MVQGKIISFSAFCLGGSDMDLCKCFLQSAERVQRVLPAFIAAWKPSWAMEALNDNLSPEVLERSAIWMQRNADKLVFPGLKATLSLMVKRYL